MSELVAQLSEWRDGVLERLPPWWMQAVVAIMIVAGILLPFAFAPTSGFLDATIKALAFVVMALGLNIVVGFAGLLDLGYVAFYALGAYSVGWFASGFFFKAHVDILSAAAPGLPGIHLNFILVLIAAALICAVGVTTSPSSRSPSARSSASSRSTAPTSASAAG
jgi:branched-chain amino acid transport system permease protein